MAATALLVDRTESNQLTEPESLWADWEAPAGGPATLPRIERLSFTYRGSDDEHLCGQGCLALEPLGPVTQTCLVGFACGCRARVSRLLLEQRLAHDRSG